MRTKLTLVTLSLVMVLVLTVTSIGMAASTSKRLSTNFTLVNLSPVTDASVQIEYVKPDGTSWSADPANRSFTIPRNFGQRIVAQYFDNTLSQGSGSVVVSSTSPLGAVVQLQARNQTATQGAYIGFSEGASSYFVPLVIVRRTTGNGLANTQLIIQNVDSTNAASVTVDLIPSPGSAFLPITKSAVSIPAKSTYFYDLEEDNSIPAGWLGSAVVTSENASNIAVVVNIFAGNHALQTFNAFPDTAVSTRWSIPQFTSKLSNNLSTPVTFQNLGGGTIAANAVTLSCKSTISTPSTFSLTNHVAVDDGGSYAFNPVDDASNPIPDNWSGACTLSSPSNVVVYVQMRRPGMSEEFAAYEAFDANSTDDFVVIPLVSKRQANGFATAVVIQNISASSTANVTLTYTPSSDYVATGGSSNIIEFSTTIAAGENLIQNHRAFDGVAGMPDGWYGTLTVASTNGVPIVGYVQLTNYLGVAGDTLMAHQAFMMANPK